MHKINFLTIISSHIKTLRDDNDHTQWDDVAVFYGFPLCVGIIAIFMCWQVPEKALELSISVFSIFAALLLSVQVALYSVSLRTIAEPDDPKKLKDYERRKKERNSMIKELNDNVSYLILLSVVILTFTLYLFFLPSPRYYGSAISITFYIHFLLTILMVVKRASIVFSREYEG